MLPLSAIHAGTTIHNKQKRISRYLPYIEQKLFIIGDTTQQVQRRYQIHCDTQCSANTEDYMQLQWHKNTSHYIELQWHTNTSHTTETMTTQRHITLHMLWYANTKDYIQLQWHINSSYTTETMTHIKTYTTSHAMICQATNTMFDYNTLIMKHILSGIQKHMHTLLLPNDPTEWYTCGHHDSIIKEKNLQIPALLNRNTSHSTRRNLKTQSVWVFSENKPKSNSYVPKSNSYVHRDHKVYKCCPKTNQSLQKHHI